MLLNSITLEIMQMLEKLINAELIRQGLPQPERLIQLNQIAITQMRSLLGSSNVKKLKG